jgi:AraC family transcriptional regulator, alkane utilization regulator
MTATPNLMTGTPNVDLLSDVLARVRLQSAIFLRGEFSAPWGFTSTDAATLAQVVAPGAQRLVLLHLAVEGTFHISVEGGGSALVHAGDAVVLPYCDVHTMVFPEGAQAVPIVELLPAPPWDAMPVVCTQGGGGPATRVLCGYLSCDDLLFNPVLGALPRLIHLRAGPGQAAEWRQASLRYVLEQSWRGDGRGLPLLARLPELVLVDCLRQYAEGLESDREGWLAAVRDPVVAKALLAIHAQPVHPWTVASLAQRAAVSRSVLGDRFARALGVSPMRYLAQWRLQLAADLLRTTDLGIAAIADKVGYESEAAFSRAFKRQLGSAPALWREQRRR